MSERYIIIYGFCSKLYAWSCMVVTDMVFTCWSRVGHRGNHVVVTSRGLVRSCGGHVVVTWSRVVVVSGHVLVTQSHVHGHANMYMYMYVTCMYMLLQHVVTCS